MTHQLLTKVERTLSGEEEEKDLVDGRRAAMKVAEECYITLQSEALG